MDTRTQAGAGIKTDMDLYTKRGLEAETDADMDF